MTNNIIVRISHQWTVGNGILASLRNMETYSSRYQEVCGTAADFQVAITATQELYDRLGRTPTLRYNETARTRRQLKMLLDQLETALQTVK